MKAFLHKLTLFQTALAISVAVHAALLTVRFVDPQAFDRVFQDAPLEVILVNARSRETPDPKAAAIAQATLKGGGDAERGRATSPLPPSALVDVGTALENESQRRVRELQEQQALMLSRIKDQLAALPPRDPRRPIQTPEEREREEKRKQLIRQLAEIERRINAENARPKKRFVSPSTREEVYAEYYDSLRRAIEDRGTEHFPNQAGKKLYGELTMIVTVDARGRVLETEVVETSGNPVLDRQAGAIARAAGPFGRFTKAMRERADQIVVVSRFNFTREETLQAKVSAAQ
ncbi:MAG: energy transducer TonB [Rhodoferax sp.]